MSSEAVNPNKREKLDQSINRRGLKEELIFKLGPSVLKLAGV